MEALYFKLCHSLPFLLIGAIVGMPLLLVNIRIAPRLGLLDWPKARGLSENQIPIVGYSMVVVCLSLLFFMSLLYGLSPFVFITTALIAIMGHFDDRRPLPASDKMFVQVLCAVTVVLFDPQIHQTMTLHFGHWGTFSAIFFILGLVNAINFIDGIDGLAGMVVVIGCIGILVISNVSPISYPYLMMAGMMAGMLVPFLYLNIKSRRGFLGNVGSYVFSYILAVMHLSLPMDGPGPISRLSINALCFLVPIADSLMVIASRTLTLRSPFQADKGHLHHRLLQTGMPLKWVLLNFTAIETGGLLMALVIQQQNPEFLAYMGALVCANFVGITGILILSIEKASKRRLANYLEKLHSGESVFFLKYRVTRGNNLPLTFLLRHRLEARMSAEIRINDMCYISPKDELYVQLRAISESLRSVAARFEPIFRRERVEATLVEQGEFVKASLPKSKALLLRTNRSS